MELKQLRLDKHITLVGASKEIDIPRDRLSRIEKGISDLPARCVIKLAELYSTTPDNIITLHQKDIETFCKKDLLGELDRAEFFLKSKDIKSVI